MSGFSTGFDVLFRLISKLTLNSEEVLKKFRFYLDHPMKYLESRYRDYCSFDEDELEEMVADTDLKTRFAADAMEGILRVEKFMWKVDHRESLDGMEYAINSLLARKGYPGIDWQFERKGMTSYDFLNTAGGILDGRGLKLVFIDDGSDSFPLIIVDKKDFEEIDDLAGQWGITIKKHFG